MYHFRVKTISRTSKRTAAGAVAYRTAGRSPTAAIAYRVGEVLIDPLTGKKHDYRAKARIDADGFGILHTEIVAPLNAPDWVQDLQTLIDKSERAEKRKDSQYFRELEISLPRELSLEDQKLLLRAFAEKHCAAHGMVAVIAIHNERASDGGENPHAHVILTMRHLKADGFGNKNRAWNDKEYVRAWRKAWAELANELLAAHGLTTRLDHRSFWDRGIDVEPIRWVPLLKGVGPPSADALDRARRCAEAKARNCANALENPTWLLDQITRMQSTFTVTELSGLIRRYTGHWPGSWAHQKIFEGILNAPELYRFGTDGEPRYSSRSLVECDIRLAKHARALNRRSRPAPEVADLRGLSEPQRRAARHLMNGPELVLLDGVAGAGKSYLLTRVRDAFEMQGRRVRGLALSAIVKSSLERDTGVPSQTIASFLKDLARAEPRAPLERGDVLVLDEAGLVGSRQLEAVLGHAERAGAKVILVGDTRQLQAIEAGAAFRSLAQTYGTARLSEVRRQRHEGDRQATEKFARGRTAEGLAHYQQAGAVRTHRTGQDAMRALIFDWVHARHANPSQLILAHRRCDAAELNGLARLALRHEGQLGEDVSVDVKVQEEMDGLATERLERRSFAVGDDILFTRNHAVLGVDNGSIGKLTAIKPGGEFHVRCADGRVIAFDPKQFGYLEHGYAMTVHKAQGATVDRAFVLASRSFDSHLTYVAMTRHREQVTLYYGEDEFNDDLVETLSRDRPKDITLDYLEADPSLTRIPDQLTREPQRETGLGRN